MANFFKFLWSKLKFQRVRQHKYMIMYRISATQNSRYWTGSDDFHFHVQKIHCFLLTFSRLGEHPVFGFFSFSSDAPEPSAALPGLSSASENCEPAR